MHVLYCTVCVVLIDFTIIAGIAQLDNTVIIIKTV